MLARLLLQLVLLLRLLVAFCARYLVIRRIRLYLRIRLLVHLRRVLHIYRLLKLLLLLLIDLHKFTGINHIRLCIRDLRHKFDRVFVLVHKRRSRFNVIFWLVVNLAVWVLVVLSHFFDLVPVKFVHVFILKFFNRLNNLVEQKLNFLCHFSLEVGSVAILLSKVTRVDQNELQLPIEVCHQLLSKLDLLI